MQVFYHNEEEKLAFEYTNEVWNTLFQTGIMWGKHILTDKSKWRIAQSIYNEKYSDKLPSKYLESYLP